MRIGLVTLVVLDYDEAIAFYVDKLGFELAENTAMGSKRWVVVRPKGENTGLLLARVADDDQADRIGDQTGGRVGFFLNVDDFAATHARLAAAGVRFLEEPRHERYGSVVVFEDLYGNRWDLIGPNA